MHGRFLNNSTTISKWISESDTCFDDGNHFHPLQALWPRGCPSKIELSNAAAIEIEKRMKTFVFFVCVLHTVYYSFCSPVRFRVLKFELKLFEGAGIAVLQFVNSKTCAALSPTPHSPCAISGAPRKVEAFVMANIQNQFRASEIIFDFGQKFRERCGSMFNTHVVY